MENKASLNIKLSADLLDKLKLIANEKELSVSALTRLILLNYVECWELENICEEFYSDDEVIKC